MRTINKTARCVEEFVKIVSQVRDDWRLGEVVPWFRGQSSAEWSLIPKFYRQKDTRRDNEDELREEFITRAPALFDRTPTNTWDWYFFMQHYGTSTRLLDWTEGALIGLYFAVKENPGCHNAAVWVIDPWRLNRRVVNRDEVVPPGDPGTLRQDRERYDKWLPDRFAVRKRWPQQPVAIYPGHIMRRIGAQRSCFTIHGSDQRGLEAIAESINIPLMKIVIPAWNAKTIRRSLETCGIDETTVFPDLEGLSKALEVKWMEPDLGLPHHGICTKLGPSKIDRNSVGVFSIRRIRKGTRLFVDDSDGMVWIAKRDLPRMPASLRKLYDDFSVTAIDESGEFRIGCPKSFDRLTVSWYLKRPTKFHRPNVRCDESHRFFALRDIDPNEELIVDFSS